MLQTRNWKWPSKTLYLVKPTAIDPTTANVIYIVLWILLPFIPSFLILKFLPGNKVAATGPFKGLTINMGGAFAGYFLVALLMLPITSKLLKFDPETYEVWTVEGDIKDHTGKNISQAFEPRLREYPNGEIRNGHFIIRLVATRMGVDRVEFPELQIEANTYETLTLQSLTHNRSSRSTLNAFCTPPDFKNHVVVYKPVTLSLDMSSATDTAVVKGDE